MEERGGLVEKELGLVCGGGDLRAWSNDCLIELLLVLFTLGEGL